jgi:tetratricopeptide (TPR) repeat protein
LLVLESVEDYVEHRILPPADLLPRYEQLVEQEEKNRRFEMMSQLDLVAEAFQARKEWWDTEFEIPEGDFSPNPEKKERESVDDDWGATEESANDWGGDGEMGGNLLEEMLVEAIAEPAVESAAKPTEAQAIEGSIEITRWNPDTPYLQAMKGVPLAEAYLVYLEQKATYGGGPAFYLDIANFFWQAGDSTHAIQVLSNLAEWQLDQHELLRIMGRLLLHWGKKEAALAAFEQVLALRPEEPQSLRDLALAHHHLNQNQQAIEQLYELSRQVWDNRFPNIGLLAVHEMNAIIGQSQQSLNLSKVDPRLLADLPTDLRVVIDWDQDGADMDLWVTDPRGEKCYYQHKRTEIGGLISDDFTGGYGPEEFLLRQAMPGTYEVKVNYYGSNSTEWIGPVTVQAELILDYGRKTERRKTISLRLEQENEVFLLGKLEVD